VPQDLALGAAAPVGLWAMRSRANSSD